MQLICTDEQSFKEIRARGGIYIDKTKHLYNIFNTGKYFFIARPRRFGKSLLCSTLAELFAGNRELFKNTWIDSSDWAWEKHPVIHLDMTQAAGAASDATVVRQGMINTLNDNALRLGIDSLAQQAPHLMFTQLINKLYLKTGKGVVVIIDEYDKPLLDVLHHPDRYPAIHDELRSFYGQLKACSPQLRLVLLTGVFKFAQTSVFSGLNNITDLTFNPIAGELLGYTQDEITTFFAEHLEALAHTHQTSSEEMMLKLQKKYNGYKFGVNLASTKLSQGVYNPFALNYVFKDQQLLDQWFTSGTPTALIKKLEDSQFTALDQNNLVIEFNILKASSDVEKMSALGMLYYAGYLTMKKYDDGYIELDFPNLEVGQALSKLLLPLITKTSEEKLRLAFRTLRTLLLNNKLQDLKDLMNHVLAQIPYSLHGQTDDLQMREHYYQTVFHLLFTAAGFVTTPEDMTNRGRIDLSVSVGNTTYLFELKMDQPAVVAIQQIKDRDYATKYRSPGHHIYAVGVTLNVKDRCVDELVFELL